VFGDLFGGPTGFDYLLVTRWKHVPLMMFLTNCRSGIVSKLANFVQSSTAAGSKIPQKYNPGAFFL